MYSLFDSKGKKKVELFIADFRNVTLWFTGGGCNHGGYSWTTLLSRRLSGGKHIDSTVILFIIFFHPKAKDVELPPPEDGDILAIHDTGAYTMSMYCK